MIEIGIGVLFAVLFVTAYLLVSRLLGEKGHRRWREIASQPFGSKAFKARPAGLFLTTGEIRDHHSQAKGTQPDRK
jgi:hypothetical protein